MNSPRFLPALGGNHALCSELLPNIGMIPLAVEFGVGQHQPDARLRAPRPVERLCEFARSRRSRFRAICDNTNC